MTINGFSVNGTLDGLVSTLRAAGTTLGGIGAAPPAPDAGEVGGEMAMLMVGFTDCAAELVLGASMAGDNVASGWQAYLNVENAAQQRLNDLRAE